MFVHLDDRHRPLHLHTHAVADHQGGEGVAVDEDHPRGNRLRLALGLSAEPAGGDENALVGLLPVQRADEPLDRGAPHRGVQCVAPAPSLGSGGHR